MKAQVMKVVIAAAVMALAVGSFAQGGGGQGRGGGGGGQGRGGFGGGMQGRLGGMQDASGIMLLNREDVQKEISLTADQKTKVETIQRESQENMRNMFQNGGGNGDREEMMKTMQKAQEETRKKIEAVLKPEQTKRLKELAVQRMGNRAVLNPDIQKELGVTDDQKAKIKTLQDRQNDANQSLMEKMRNQEIDREGMQEARRKNDEALSTELGKILTDAQKTKLKEMGGKPFTFATTDRDR